MLLLAVVVIAAAVVIAVAVVLLFSFFLACPRLFSLLARSLFFTVATELVLGLRHTGKKTHSLTHSLTHRRRLKNKSTKRGPTDGRVNPRPSFAN